MKYGEYDVTIGDGKYRFRADGNGEFSAWRNGEPWEAGVVWLQGERHSKSFVCLMMEFQDARDALLLLGKLFTAREIAAACERRGIPTDRDEGFSLALIKTAIERAERRDE